MTGPGEPCDQRLARFAEKACQSRQTIAITLEEAYALVLALEGALVSARGLESHDAFRLALGDLRLACSQCGEFDDQAKEIILLGGKGGVIDRVKSVVFGGPNAAALGQGRCPRCNGTQGTATFDPSPSGVVELRRAVAAANVPRIREILARGVDVDERDPVDGATSLTYAAEKGLEGVVEFLLQVGASPNAYSKETDATPLICAAMHGHAGCVRLLLGAGADVNVRESNNLAALHYAAVKGHADVVAALLAAGADPEVKPTPDGWTPLFYAIEKGHEAVVSALLKGGASPNTPNKDGISPVLYAATKGRRDNIRQLLRQAGARS